MRCGLQEGRVFFLAQLSATGREGFKRRACTALMSHRSCTNQENLEKHLFLLRNIVDVFKDDYF